MQTARPFFAQKERCFPDKAWLFVKLCSIIKRHEEKRGWREYVFCRETGAAIKDCQTFQRAGEGVSPVPVGKTEDHFGVSGLKTSRSWRDSPVTGNTYAGMWKCVTGGFMIASMLSSFYGWELFNFHQQFRVSAKWKNRLCKLVCNRLSFHFVMSGSPISLRHKLRQQR